MACSFYISGYAAQVNGSDSLDVNYAEARIDAFDTSTVNLYAGSDVAFLDAFDRSNINVYEGELSWLTLFDESNADIYKSDLSWLLMGENSSVTIYGSNFEYSGGHLSGQWLDGCLVSFFGL